MKKKILAPARRGASGDGADGARGVVDGPGRADFPIHFDPMRPEDAPRPDDGVGEVFRWACGVRRGAKVQRELARRSGDGHRTISTNSWAGVTCPKCLAVRAVSARIESEADRVDHPFRVLSLFTGAAGLELGICGALGGRGHRVVAYVEREAFACAILARQMEAGRLAPAPICTDVRSFDGRPFSGVVDLVAGGFPCTDISDAGKRAGIDGDASGLWREFARIVRDVRPSFVFVENVDALLVRGIDRVLGDLAALGFDAEWGCLGARDAGAPHERQRIFVLAALPHAFGCGLRLVAEWQQQRSAERRHAVSVNVGAQGMGRPVSGASHDDGAGDASRGIVDGCRAPWPPGPADAEGWAAYLDAHPGLEPAIRGGADGLADRVDELRACGNGVVPDQAEVGFRTLAARLFAEARG